MNVVETSFYRRTLQSKEVEVMESNSDLEQVDEKSPLVKETVEKYNKMDANKEQVKVHESVDETSEQSAIVTEKVEEIVDDAAKKPQCSFQKLRGLVQRIRNFLKSFCCW